MTTSAINPPYDELKNLAQPLTDGEWLFLNWLMENLTSDWEIYVQPYMNGLRPDFVLLSPKKGIAVYEIKDWNLSAIDYRYVGDPPQLMGFDREKQFKLGGDRDPVVKIRSYKSEIFDLYCPSLGRNHGFGAIVGGIVFPFSPTEQVSKLLFPAFKYYGLDSHRKHNLIIGCDMLKSDCNEQERRQVLPSLFSINQEMTGDAVDDLRHWLVEPDSPRDQRKNAFEELDNKQKDIVGRQEKGWRRMQGPAGSGKTLVLCGRTARLVGEGKRVLLITFNITLLNYLRDTVARFFAGVGPSRRWVSKQYEIMNFHHFCSRLALVTGNQDAYRQLWRGAFGNANVDSEEVPPDMLETILTKTLPKLALEWAAELPENEKFDAILVDEAQDLRPKWWDVLVKALKPDGEAILAADRTQNVYSVDQSWANGPTKGFRGRWIDLSVSYRLPPEIAHQALSFINQFLPEAASIRPESPKSELGLFAPNLSPKLACLRWINIPQTDEEKIKACMTAMEEMIKDSEVSSSPLNYADITILVESEAVGVALRKAITALGIRVIDTFDSDPKQEKRKKMAFRKGDGRVKITTVFSYKGWETKALILQIGHGHSERDHALFYTGMTRVKASESQSYLTVINSAPDYRSWGSSWTTH